MSKKVQNLTYIFDCSRPSFERERRTGCGKK